jgi:hypothetical protein
MTTKRKLSVEDFYSQFHGLEHHNDPGEHVKTKHHLHHPKLHLKHKGFDFKQYAKSKSKKG